MNTCRNKHKEKYTHTVIDHPDIKTYRNIYIRIYTHTELYTYRNIDIQNYTLIGIYTYRDSHTQRYTHADITKTQA